MEIRNLTPGGYASNCYLITAQDTAVLIDCSAPVPDVLAALADTGTALAAILLTHGHFDHMLTLAAVKEATAAPIYLARGDADLPGDGSKNAFSLFFGLERSYPAADILFENGAQLDFGPLSFRTVSTPGHTRGSSLFLTDNVAFTGDTLFAAGYGRYDLYGGDPHALQASLKALAALPQELLIYPGHGDHTTLGAALDTVRNFF